MSFVTSRFLSFFTQLAGVPSLRLPSPPKETHREPNNHYQHVTLPKTLVNSPDMYSCQSSSLLISKLPVEIRNIIWMYVMGANTIHFVYNSNPEALRGYICDKPGPATCQSMAHGGVGLLKLSESDKKRLPTMGWMGAMTACRAFYFETTQILYSRNTFDLSETWWAIEHVPWLLPLYSLSQISDVTVTILDLYAGPNGTNFSAWYTLWKILGLVRDLKQVKVEIAIKENLEKATTKKEDLIKIEGNLLGQLKALEDAPGRKKAKWEIVFPCEPEEGESDAARELTLGGWKITRI